LKSRSDEIEIMDNLDCKGEVVHQTLRELEIINRWLGGNAVTVDAVRQLILMTPRQEFSIADLGCGSGDMLKLLYQWGNKNGVRFNLTGIDANPHVIDFAKSNCGDYPIKFETLNILSPEFQKREFDIVIGTLFYHHFSTSTLIDFFLKLKGQVRTGIIINDIHRHWFAYHSIRLLTRLFSRSSMVRFDAPLSVRRAFTRKEMIEVLEKSGLIPFLMRWKWAFRWQVIYRHKTT
jgi:2-polyprenyl-3-methyl-5-hydroxy-6-metoxy-1,4-benzoquinol methylase